MSHETYLSQFETWYKSLKVVTANRGPANGTLATALVFLNRLIEDYNLDFNSHIAKGGMQLKGASGTAVAKILKSFGEVRPFAKEGGRTNRGGPGEIQTLIQTLELMQLETLNDEERNEILRSFQSYLVEKVKDYHNRQKLKLEFNPSLSTWTIIHSILETAKNEGKAGPVAQHLVGAKLQLRFPDIEISNESASTADMPTNRQGDFAINQTVFHVTVAPMQPVFEKCQQNLSEGLKVFLLVPDSKLAAARQLGEQFGEGKFAIESLESFLSQNIEEISKFSLEDLKKSITTLIELYNKRVDEVEIDKSLMIELPSNLERKNG